MYTQDLCTSLHKNFKEKEKNRKTEWILVNDMHIEVLTFKEK